MREELCIVGVDAGTSVVKAVAFDYAGTEVSSHELPVELLRLHPDWVEQNMDALWQSVKACVGEVLRKLRERNRGVAGIGITSTGDGTWLMDRGGRPLRGGILWCDGRAAKIVERWHAADVARRAFAICGTSVFTGSQAVQLTWLRENEPEALRQAGVIFHAKDWLFYQMTGVVSSDETDESLTMLRMSTRKYDPDLFRIFGIEDLFPKFPPVKPAEENVAPILPAVAEELGVAKDTPIGSGPMDVAACALGTGAIEHGQACSILGTAGIHQVIMAEPNLEPNMVGMTLCHGVKNRWMRMLAAMTATPNLDWFLKELGGTIRAAAQQNGEDIYSRLEEIVDSVPPGSEGVIFHPYLFPGGERGPFVKPTARASFTGLNMNHSVRHLLRSVYEGVAFATLDCYRNMPIDPETVYLSGGGANSPAWRQIVADCLGKPVSVPEGSQFGAKGAALNLGVAVGMYRDARDAVDRAVRMALVCRPDARNAKLYRELYPVYRKTAELQMDLWDMRARILAGANQV
jgi:erythritol kinase (D-erythritol 1-phosphate-forming)